MDKYQATLLTRWLIEILMERPILESMEKLYQQIVQVSGDIDRNYRVIVEIEDERLVVTAIQVGHRRNVYDNK